MTIESMNISEMLIEVVVCARTRVAEDVLAFELSRSDGLPLPEFSAGSHIDVHLPNGMTRQYSLCGALENTGSYTIAVLREANGRGGSQYLCDHVGEGARLGISAPRNLFPLDAEADHSYLLAGGIGITPIMSMAEALDRADKPFELHYACRSRARMAMSDVLTERFGDRVHKHLDDDPATQLDLSRDLASHAPGAHLYICGPEGLITAALDAADRIGWPEEAVHVERFSAVVEARPDDQPFEVVVASTGQRLRVDVGETVVDVLEDVGIEIEFSCEQGICGTCVTRVLKGIPDHRDHFLSPEERARNDRFTPCCSRAVTPVLVLDL